MNRNKQASAVSTHIRDQAPLYLGQQGSHFAHLKQAASANRLMVAQRLDPCMSEVLPWDQIPQAHTKMMKNEHKPGNMAVLVQSPRVGLSTFEEVLK